MKNLVSFLLGVLFISLISFKTSAYDVRKSTAEAVKVSKLYIFCDAAPVTEYDVLGTVSANVFKSQYATIRDNLVERAQKEFPNADAVIMRFKSHGIDKADVIKFK